VDRGGSDRSGSTPVGLDHHAVLHLSPARKQFFKIAETSDIPRGSPDSLVDAVMPPAYS
jgi:hypothetical protein